MLAAVARIHHLSDGTVTGVITDDMFKLIVSATIVTLFLTPYLVTTAWPLSQRIVALLERFHLVTATADTPANPTDFSLYGNDFTIRGFIDPHGAVVDANGDGIYICGDSRQDFFAPTGAGPYDATTDDCDEDGPIENVHIENVTVVVQGWPTAGQQVGHRWILLGLYEGGSLTRREPLFFSAVLPHRITIFEEPNRKITQSEEASNAASTWPPVPRLGPHSGSTMTGPGLLVFRQRLAWCSSSPVPGPRDGPLLPTTSREIIARRRSSRYRTARRVVLYFSP